MSKIEDKLAKKLLKTRMPMCAPLAEQLQERAKVGLKKYGVSLEDETLPLEEWMEHSIQEGLDMMNYLEKLMSVCTDNTLREEVNKIQSLVIQATTDIKHIKQFLHVK